MLAEDPALTLETFVNAARQLRGSLDLDKCGFEAFKVGIMCGISAVILWWDAAFEDLPALADKELYAIPKQPLKLAESVSKANFPGTMFGYLAFWQHNFYGRTRDAADKLYRVHSQEAYYAGIGFGIAAAIKKYR